MTSLGEQYWKVPKEDRPRPKLEDCVPRRLYHVGCRNLTYAVYNGDGGFIGIRVKWKSRYLFTELHWDKCESFGTVHTAIDTGIDLPDHIELKEYVDGEKEGTVTTYKPLFDWLVEQEIKQG